MFDYKNAQFYTDYFSSLEGFSILEEFKESEDKNEKNLYIGSVEVLNTIHPLVLRVEIPFTFPHNKLVFRTKSLSGYPHLIHNGKIEYGDWFCLNTPFAETPEEQLNQEITRLKEWISHQMREDLPAIIKDANVKKALAFANAYEWENLDEVKEFCSQAMLTFVGDFHNNFDYFKQKLGYLYCIKTPDNRFYAIDDPSLANYKLPYIIVDQAPKSAETLSDFLLLKEQYEWDDKTCKHLLPNLNISKKWQNSFGRITLGNKPCSEEELKQIELIEAELFKEDSYLPGYKYFSYQNSIIDKNAIKKIKVLSSQKPLLLERIKQCIKEKGECTENVLMADYYNDMPNDIENSYEEHYFVFGVKHDEGIVWYIIFTSKAFSYYEIVHFELTQISVELKKLISQP